MRYRVQQESILKVVDGDDWLDKSLLPQFVQLLKHTHSDVISNDFNLVDDARTKKVTKRRKAVSNSYHYNREWGFAEAVMDLLITIHSMTIRTDVLQKNDIRVDEHCFYEDQEYILYPIPYCTSITFSTSATVSVQTWKEWSERGHKDDDQAS